MNSLSVEMRGFNGGHLAYLDLETTGLNAQRHEILEICVMVPSMVVDQVRSRILPEYLPYLDMTGSMSSPVSGWTAWCAKTAPLHLETADPVALQICGFNEHEWRSAISLWLALYPVGFLLQGATVVGHGVNLDIDFLRESYARCGFMPAGVKPDLKYKVDTVTLIWEHLLPHGLTRGNLADACTALGIPNEGSHRALADCLRCKAVLDALVFRLEPGWFGGIRERIAEIEAARGRP